MNSHMKGAIIALAAAAGFLSLTSATAAGQQGGQAATPTTAAKPFTPGRTPDGQPDLTGVWSANPGGTYNIQDLEFQSLYQNGKADPALRGKSRLIDPMNGKIPYQPWALPIVKKRTDHHLDPTPDLLDPSSRCFLQGSPRWVLNREWEIFQAPGTVVFFNMAHHGFRVVSLENTPHLPSGIKLWNGDSRGHWEGNTLVVDVTNNNDQTWFDIVGDLHTDALHVVERITLVDANTISYEARIEDPKAFTRPWTMGVNVRRMKDYGELWEEACFEGNERSLRGMLGHPKDAK